ncbi:MAG: flagellar hook-length control protein FliK [Cyanobacteria bacterium REEB65]|nr:flagellar hook-length control protein FliK [Cyanobacteria bacterium REEB65]
MDVRPVSQASPPAAEPEAQGPALVDGQIVTGKVLSSGPSGVEIEVAGRVLSVQADMPLAPGDQLAMKVASSNAGQVRLVMLGLQGSPESLLGDSNLATMLEQMGLPPDRPHRDAARLAFAEAGTVDPALVKALMRQPASRRPAAAFLLARQLPVTAETLEMAERFSRTANFGEQIQESFEQASRDPDMPPQLASLVLPDSPDAAVLTQALRNLVQAFTPPEAELAKALAEQEGGSELQDPQPPPQATVAGAAVPEASDGPAKAAAQDPGLAQTPLSAVLEQRLAANLLVALQRELVARAQGASASPAAATTPSANPQASAAPPEVDPPPLQNLSLGLRFQQLLDAVAAQGPLGGQEIRLPLRLGKSPGELTVQSWKGNAKDPDGHARVVIDLDMPSLGPLRIDVMLAGGHLNGHMTAVDGEIRDYLADRLTELQNGIANVGIQVGHLAVSTPGDPPPAGPAGARFDVKL